MEFKPFPKLARLNREIVITEKIDGTNAQVFIYNALDTDAEAIASISDPIGGWTHMRAGSRTKWITPGKQTDNAGFAGWVKDNAEDLFKLGPGQHFGEWWGQGIQRRYGLTEKRFSLFNTGRWADPRIITREDYRGIEDTQQFAPDCCHVVPVLYQGPFNTEVIDGVLFRLQKHGSFAAPAVDGPLGFENPEGIVIYHTAAKQLFKVTLDHDGLPKSLAPAA